MPCTSFSRLEETAEKKPQVTGVVHHLCILVPISDSLPHFLVKQAPQLGVLGFNVLQSGIKFAKNSSLTTKNSMARNFAAPHSYLEPQTDQVKLLINQCKAARQWLFHVQLLCRCRCRCRWGW